MKSAEKKNREKDYNFFYSGKLSKLPTFIFQKWNEEIYVDTWDTLGALGQGETFQRKLRHSRRIYLFWSVW